MVTQLVLRTALATFLVFSYGTAAWSVTFTVNSVGDGSDSNLADGLCDDGTGACTLRAAIEQANNSPALDNIHFALPGPAPQAIFPTALLPSVTAPVIIDGYTQPGAFPNTNPPFLGTIARPGVILNGLAAPGSPGLVILGGNSIVRGLVIINWEGDGLRLDTNGGNVVEGNFIGTDGVSAQGNGFAMHVRCPGNQIGGTSSASVNVISASRFGNGIFLGGGNNTVQGNLIGTNASGTVALGSQFDGIEVASANNLIGGTASGAGNLISGNGTFAGNGIDLNTLNGIARDNIIQGNRIGTDVTGTMPLGNTTGGIYIDGVDGNTIGGTEPGAGNIIAFNRQRFAGQGGDGVTMPAGRRNAILGNAMFGNEDLGIDLNDLLGGAGPTPNDAGDLDAGANDLQNFPVLTNAWPSLIEGTLDSRASTSYRLEFFGNLECDPTFHGEGRFFFAATDVMTDPAGHAGFAVPLAVVLPPGFLVTATATDAEGNTSEFSRCLAVSDLVGLENTTWGDVKQRFRDND